jgi:hypothetical protein
MPIYSSSSSLGTRTSSTRSISGFWDPFLGGDMIGPVSNKLKHKKQNLTLIQAKSNNKLNGSEQALLSCIEPGFMSFKIMPLKSFGEEKNYAKVFHSL